MLAIAPDRLATFAALCARERCPHAVVGQATADGQLVLTDALAKGTPAEKPIDLPLSVLLGKPPRTVRDAAHVAAAVAPFATARRRPVGRPAARAAAAGRRRQDVPGHHRRPHRRRHVRARPDGRPLAGAGRRRRRDRDRLRRDHRRGDGDGRTRPGRAAGRGGVGAPGRRRGDHQHRVGPDRPAGRHQAVGQLDGGRRPPRRGRAPLRRRPRRRARAVPRAGDRHPGRQGLAVDAHQLAGRRAAAGRDRAAVADGDRVRAGDRRAPAC